MTINKKLCHKCHKGILERTIVSPANFFLSFIDKNWDRIKNEEIVLKCDYCENFEYIKN